MNCVCRLLWLIQSIVWLLFSTFCQPIYAADFGVPLVDPNLPIRVVGDQLRSSHQGSYSVYQVFGHCELRQGSFVGHADSMTLWVDRSSQFNVDPPVKVLVEMNGAVDVQWSDQDRLQDLNWTGRLFTRVALDVHGKHIADPDVSNPSMPWQNERGQFAGGYFFPRLDNSQFTIGPDGDIQPVQYTIGNREEADLQGSFTGGNSPLGGFVLDQQGNIVETIEAVPQNQRVFQLPSPVQPGVPNNPPNPGSIPNSMGPAVGAVPNIVPNPVTGTVPTGDFPRPTIGAETFEFTGRGGSPPNVQTVIDAARGETVAVLSGGIRLRFSGTAYQSSSGAVDLGAVLLEADRAVIWTSDFQKLLSGNASGIPIEVYLEGNVVFQQGQRKIYAERMYYNAQAEIGTILDAEILTPVPQYEGILRLKADVVQQRSRQNFLAYDAAFTSSRLGVPRYWLQSDRIELADERDPNDPNQYLNAQRTGATNMEATARNNFVYLAGAPIFYWPFLNTNVNTPNFYLRNIKIKNDQIFGQQVFLETDLYQILGIDGPDGTDWRLSTDYLSKRGFALGTTFEYNVPRFIFDGPTNGRLDVWGLKDGGLDILGSDRFNMIPEETTRGRGLLQHRQLLSRDLEFRAEVGYISDRNFLEEYFEREWDTQKDQTTTLRIRKYNDNQMLDLWGQARLNEFFTETESLPRLDYYILGQNLFDRVTWYSNSHVGYEKLKIASTPLAPQDAAKFQLQSWEVASEGIRAGTRQELAAPINAGPVKIVPYLNGEVITYGEVTNGDPLTRLTGQTGVRASLPIWRVNEDIQSRLFNVNGLAHKVNFKSEFFYADASENIDLLPLYDPLDDNSQEHFRRRLVFNTFNGTLPDQFDSRSYAIRQGLQRYVTAASQDVVEDQMQFRLGIDQRWQTKRGLPGRERITDLVEFDIGGILFPKADRDNFGETAGALNYEARVHLGDRVTLLSDGYADVFEQGLKIVSAGAMISRPGRGEWYVGLTRLTGPIDSLIANSNINYRMNEKFIISGGSTFDFGQVGNVGQSVSVTRIGESFLTQFGFNVDSGRDNASFNFNFEPRFSPIRRLGAVGGKLIPPAGLNGLE